MIPALARPGAAVALLSAALIVAAVRSLVSDPDRRKGLRQSSIFAAASLDGEREKAALKALFEGIG